MDELIFFINRGIVPGLVTGSIYAPAKLNANRVSR